MNRSKLLHAFKINGHKLLMSTTQANTVESIAEKKLEHYRNLNALESSDAKPIDWDQAKPFESIPGPKPLPIIGNAWRFLLPKIGTYFGKDFTEIYRQFYDEYGDIAILKGIIGRPPLLFLFNPKEIEKLHRNEGIWPIRNGLESFTYYRSMNKHILESGGLVTLQGEDWFKFRTVVNPILMQPRNVVQYTEKMNLIADELVETIDILAEKHPEGELPEYFQTELYKWALESIGVVTMDTHLGCLKRDTTNPDAQTMIKGVLTMFDLMYKLDILPSLWKYFSTPDWKKYVKTLDLLIQTNLKYINKQLDRIESGETGQTENEITSVLQKMIKVDRKVALAMSVDMLIAGIDTTGRILGAALYYLAKNPNVQAEFRKEAVTLLENKDSPVTKEVLSKALYTKAVVKETTRLAPIAIGNARTTTKDLVFGGYQVPMGTEVISGTLLLSRLEKHFPRATEFLPERWLPTTTGELSHKNTNPFVFAPFGFGSRSCIGKRLANLELETALLKIVRNFELSWNHPDMRFKTTTLHGIADPLKIQVKTLEH